MIKMVFMLRRRPEMSITDFIQRYERGHAPLGVKHVPNAIHYVRRFIEPITGPFSDAQADFDVITELWFQNQQEANRALARLAEPAVAKEIAEDEEALFDGAASRVYMVIQECESQLPSPPLAAE